MAWKRCETRSTDHQYFIFPYTKFELFPTFPDQQSTSNVSDWKQDFCCRCLVQHCSFLYRIVSRNFELVPPKVSESGKFITVMTDYYHSQQPSAVWQDKTKFWWHLWLVSKLPRQVNISGYRTTWFLKSFSQETYSRYFLNKRLHKRLSHETKSTFKFLADLEAHCAEAKTNKTPENSLVVPSCDVLCHCLPHT